MTIYQDRDDGTTAMSTKTRASLRLLATTSLSTGDALAVVRSVAEQAGPGTVGIPKAAWTSVDTFAQIEDDTSERLQLSINTVRRAVMLCSFSAETWVEDGATNIRVGGLEEYRTSSSALFGFIPFGPKLIEGLAPFQVFLDRVQAGLLSAEPAAEVRVAPALP